MVNFAGIALSPKCRNFVKNYFFACKNSHAHLQYIHNKFAWFQNDPLKTVRVVDYTNSIPYNAKSCKKWLSSKGCNSVKINSSSTKNPHAYLQYVHNRYAKFQKDPLKTVGGVDYTNSIPYNAKRCLKWSLTWKLSKSKMQLFCQKLFFRLQKFTCTSSIYPQQVCMVSKWSIENCKRSWLHKLHTIQCKKLPKMTKFERL